MLRSKIAQSAYALCFTLVLTQNGCTQESDFSATSVSRKTSTKSAAESAKVENKSSSNSSAENPPAATPQPVPEPEVAPEPVASTEPFQPCILGAADKAKQPIVAKVYQLRNGADNLEKDFATGVYRTKICMLKFDVPDRAFTEGFPGIPGLFEWFAIEAKSKLVAPTNGTYRFRLLSDDGAILYLNNNVVVNNDGQHSPSSKEATVSLTAGSHDLRLLYFQGPATQIALQLFWTPPGKGEEIIPTSAFRYVDF